MWQHRRQVKLYSFLKMSHSKHEKQLLPIKTRKSCLKYVCLFINMCSRYSTHICPLKGTGNILGSCELEIEMRLLLYQFIKLIIH